MSRTTGALRSQTPGQRPPCPPSSHQGVGGGADRGPWTVGSGPGDEGAGAARGGHLPRECGRGAVGDSLAGEGRREESERGASGSGVAAGPGARARRGPGHWGWGRTSGNGFFSLQRGAKPDTGQRLRRDPPGEGARTPEERRAGPPQPPGPHLPGESEAPCCPGGGPSPRTSAPREPSPNVQGARATKSPPGAMLGAAGEGQRGRPDGPEGFPASRAAKPALLGD